ncbi:hypothetical protein [Acinetobacter sp. MB5]|uniref:hypothetical protein n=1 Tax=Acinetobacter sp. MB5 TaxID=2069438 RepID=UPI000DD023D1|nr:hypothetical protein [Acinetobacter sp. MB5]
MNYQIIEVQGEQVNLACPYCQHLVLNWDEEQYVQPCEHTAFIAMDLGFEYISDRFEACLAHSVDDIHDQEMNVLEEVTSAQVEQLLIYKMDLGVAGLYRYVGITQF